MTNLNKKERFGENDIKIAVLEANLASFKEILQDIKQAVDKLDDKLTSINKSTDDKLTVMNKDMDDKFSKVYGRMWLNFFFMIAGFGSVLGALAHALHWIG